MSNASEPGSQPGHWSLSLLVASFGLVVVILVNICIIWYFLIGMPSECATLADSTAGRETCGPGPGVPYILLLNVTLIAASLCMLWRWYKREKSLN